MSHREKGGERWKRPLLCRGVAMVDDLVTKIWVERKGKEEKR